MAEVLAVNTDKVLEIVMRVARWRDNTILPALRPHRRHGIQTMRDRLRTATNETIRAIPPEDRNVR